MSAPLRFYDLLGVLCEHHVEFVVIGGFALAFHGVPRGTKDVDIVPDPQPENIARLWRALEALDATPAESAEFGNWVLRTRFGRLDVMQWVAGVDSYLELRARAIVDEPPEIGCTIAIAGRDDLVTMKEEAGRDQDLIDIRALRMAEGLEE